MKKYRTSRLRELIFPHELIIDKYHVLSRKRHFPVFWIVTEESIPLSKLASIQIHRGLLFSKLIIENSGGPYPIVVNGLWNKVASEARDVLEMIEREMHREGNVDEIVGGDYGSESDPVSPHGGNPNKNHANYTSGDDIHEPEPLRTSAPGGENSRDEKPRENRHDRPEASLSTSRTRDRVRTESETVSATKRRTDPEMFDDRIRNLTVKLPPKFGELPCDEWKPKAPWEPLPQPEQTTTAMHDPLPIIDPAEFLNSDFEPDIDSETYPVDGKTNAETPIDRLVNWWDMMTGELRFEIPKPKRKRKLN